MTWSSNEAEQISLSQKYQSLHPFILSHKSELLHHFFFGGGTSSFYPSLKKISLLFERISYNPTKVQPTKH